MARRELTWPSLRADNEANVVDSQQARIPTWPAQLLRPSDAAAAYPQPNLLLQLTQILEWEIWNHNQTRTELSAEKHRCSDLESKVWNLSRHLSASQESCQTVYHVLDDHRRENVALKQEVESLTAELEPFRHSVSFSRTCGCIIALILQFVSLREAEIRIPRVGDRAEAHEDAVVKREEVGANEGASWRPWEMTSS
jgi:hypothetical protein